MGKTYLKDHLSLTNVFQKASHVSKYENQEVIFNQDDKAYKFWNKIIYLVFFLENEMENG